MTITINRDAINNSDITDIVVYYIGQSNHGRAGIGGQPAHIVANVAIPNCTVWNVNTQTFDNLTLDVNGGTESPTESGDDDYAIDHNLSYLLSQAFPGKNIRAMQLPFGGSWLNYITASLVAGGWRPDINVSTTIRRYEILKAQRTAALATLGKYVELGVIWYQGEADSDTLAARQYHVSERYLFQQLPKDLGRLKVISIKLNTAIVNVPEVNFVTTINTQKQATFDAGLVDVILTPSGNVGVDDLHNVPAVTTALAISCNDNL
jgi:hypothetical protein